MPGAVRARVGDIDGIDDGTEPPGGRPSRARVALLGKAFDRMGVMGVSAEGSGVAPGVAA